MKTLDHRNAVVVGAGAGGGIAAKELSEAGLSVILFERGKWETFIDHDHDELISQRTFVLENAFGPDNERYRNRRSRIHAVHGPAKLRMIFIQPSPIFPYDRL